MGASDFEVLREALAKSPQLADRILGQSIVEIKNVELDQLEDIRDSIGSELASTGVGPDGAINDRGKSLDRLIDMFSADWAEGAAPE
jgi:hypothetical protein